MNKNTLSNLISPNRSPIPSLSNKGTSISKSYFFNQAIPNRSQIAYSNNKATSISNSYFKNRVSPNGSPIVSSKNKGSSISNSYITYKILNSELKRSTSNNRDVSQFFENFYKENKSLVLSDKYSKDSFVDINKKYELNQLEKLQKRSLRQCQSDKKTHYLNKVYCLLKNKDTNYLTKRKNIHKAVYKVDTNGNFHITIKDNLFKEKEKNFSHKENYSHSTSKVQIEKTTKEEKKNLFNKINEFNNEYTDISVEEEKTEQFIDNFKMVIETDNYNESDVVGPNNFIDKTLKMINISKSKSDIHLNRSKTIRKDFLKNELDKIKNIQTATKETRIISTNNSPKFSSIKLPPLINLVYNKKVHRKEFKLKDGIQTRINFMDCERTKLLNEVYGANSSIRLGEDLPVLQNLN